LFALFPLIPITFAPKATNFYFMDIFSDKPLPEQEMVWMTVGAVMIVLFGVFLMAYFMLKTPDHKR
jgi:hypothetical protein